MNTRPGIVKTATRAAVACALATMSGCALFGAGSDSSEAEVVHKESCKFDLKQAAKVAGDDSADVVENVIFDPGCNVRIEFRQTVSEEVEVIEAQGAKSVLGETREAVTERPQQASQDEGDPLSAPEER